MKETIHLYNGLSVRSCNTSVVRYLFRVWIFRELGERGTDFRTRIILGKNLISFLVFALEFWDVSGMDSECTRTCGFRKSSNFYTVPKVQLSVFQKSWYVFLLLTLLFPLTLEWYVLLEFQKQLYSVTGCSKKLPRDCLYWWWLPTFFWFLVIPISMEKIFNQRLGLNSIASLLSNGK